MTLKVGDRVVYNQTHIGQMPLVPDGSVGTVIEVSGRGIGARVSFDRDPDDHRYLFADNLTVIPTAPEKRPSEVILEKLIEAKREFAEARSRRVAASKEESVLTEKIGLYEAQLKNAINKEASHPGLA